MQADMTQKSLGLREGNIRPQARNTQRPLSWAVEPKFHYADFPGKFRGSRRNGSWAGHHRASVHVKRRESFSNAETCLNGPIQNITHN